MKTNQFIKEVQKLGFEVSEIQFCSFEKYNNKWLEITRDGNYVATVFEDTYYSFDVKNISSRFKDDKGHDLLVLILEYTATPLREREEEKKYWLIFPKGYDNVPLYVRFNWSGYDSTHSSDDYGNTNSQTQFTQKEIDDMPFDTSFFIKEEV